jgi:hypothetical protein
LRGFVRIRFGVGNALENGTQETGQFVAVFGQVGFAGDVGQPEGGDAIIRRIPERDWISPTVEQVRFVGFEKRVNIDLFSVRKRGSKPTLTSKGKPVFLGEQTRAPKSRKEIS